jgi:hypothetical protein
VCPEQRQEQVRIDTAQPLQAQFLAADGDAAFQDAELQAFPGDDCLDRAGAAQQLGSSVRRLRRHDRGRAGFDDSRLFPRDLGERVTKVLLMVQTDRGNHRDVGVDDIGRVPLTAESDLDDGDVHRGVGERGIRQRGHHLEEGELDVELAVDEFYIRCQFAVGLDEATVTDRLAVDDDALRDLGQVRAGVTPGPQPEPAQQLVDHARGRRLAVGSGHVDAAIGLLRRAEQVDQRPDPVQRGRHPALAPPLGDLSLDAASQRGVPLRLGAGHGAAVYGPQPTSS